MLTRANKNHHTDVNVAVKPPMQCSHIPVVNVSWTQGEEFRSGEANAMGSGLFSGYATEERNLAVSNLYQFPMSSRGPNNT
jgi:hypothetical protein